MSAHRPSPSAPPVRHGGGPGRPKDLGKRSAILTAAKALFLEHGYTGASMDAIAAGAGVSKLTVYSHFGDKENLFNTAVHSTCDEMVPDTLFIADAQGPLREQLLDIGRAFFGLVSSEAALATQRMMLSPSTDDQTRRMFWHAGPERLNAAFITCLAPRVAAGELHIQDMDLAASQFFCLVKGELHTSMMCGLACQDDPQAAERHVVSAVDFFLRAYTHP
jgi:TetR/AcrR family transcriptional repressor of mexJK operon